MARRNENAGMAGVTGIRALLIAEWDKSMVRWRIPGAVYAYEEALKSGGPVVITSSRLLKAFMLATLPADRFAFGGVDYGSSSDPKWFRLDGDELSEWHGPEEGETVIDTRNEGRRPLVAE